jgi:flagellin
VSSSRATIGAGMNRLQSAVAVMQAQSQNTQAAESTIRDANVAEEVANLTKYQILAQSGIAALAQANGNSQIVLALLEK